MGSVHTGARFRSLRPALFWSILPASVLIVVSVACSSDSTTGPGGGTEPPPEITTESLPDGQVGTSYGYTLEATGGSGTHTWSLGSGSLPAGLSLSGVGLISGTPTADGTSEFTVRVTAGGQSSTRQLSVTVLPIPQRTLTVSSGGTGNGNVTSNPAGISCTIEGTDESGSCSASFDEGQQVSLSQSAASGHTFVNWGESCSGSGSCTVSLIQNETVSVTFDPTLRIMTTSLAGGQVGTVYSDAPDATGGNGPMTWSLANGALPAGLELSAEGEISGTPTMAEEQTFTVLVTSGGQTATQELSITIETNLGSIRVAAETSGDDIDPDGYIAEIDVGARTTRIGPNGETGFGGLIEGDHEAGLSDVAGNCTVQGENPRTVTVIAGEVQSVTFTVECEALGAIEVTTHTTGGTPDPDGYDISIDGSPAGSIGTDETQSYAVLAGTHSVEISGLARNCTVVGQNPWDLGVASGETAAARFDIECPIPQGTLEVTSSTTGAVPDADGYELIIDGTSVGAIGTVELRSFSLDQGQHAVELLGLSPNCAVSGANPRDETVTAYETTTTTFAVDCPCTVLAPGDADGDRLPNCAETNTYVYLSPTDTGTDPNDPDTDGDYIEDGDEVLGTTGGLELPEMGLSPLRQDILVEYDWFDDALQCAPHSHRPTAAAIGMVTAAFANAPVQNPDGSTGINYVQDYGQGGVFTGGNLISDADGVLDGGVNSTEFRNHKLANFDPNRNGYFHYTILPHRYNTNSGSSGQAEFPGDDMIVSLYCANSDRNVAHTIVHELGHNLLLHHGGREATNYKPNYNSVMNYRYQFPGIDNNCTPPGDGVLDYSIGVRPPLDENNLDETQGVCGNPPGPGWDWNGNGDPTEVGIAFDINQADGLYQVLGDFNDWANIVFSGLSSADGASMFVRAPEVVSCVNPAPLPGN